VILPHRQIGDTVVAIDSKTSRHTNSKTQARSSLLHLVSAFAASMGIVLDQTTTAWVMSASKPPSLLREDEAPTGTTVTGCV
jgi:hypothetical protein